MAILWMCTVNLFSNLQTMPEIQDRSKCLNLTPYENLCSFQVRGSATSQECSALWVHTRSQQEIVLVVGCFPQCVVVWLRPWAQH